MREPTQTTDELLWEQDPELAARKAFLEVMLFWDSQFERGEYPGVPLISSGGLRTQREPALPEVAGVWATPIP